MRCASSSRALRQRAEVLDQLAAADEERRQRLQQALARAGVADPGFLSDQMQVPDGFEHTIDLYIEAFRDAVLVPHDVAAARGGARARAGRRARGAALRVAPASRRRSNGGGHRRLRSAAAAASPRSRSSAWRRRPTRR